MQPHIDDVIDRYGAEIARLTQRAIIAEARAAQAEQALADIQTATEGSPDA